MKNNLKIVLVIGVCALFSTAAISQTSSSGAVTGGNGVNKPVVKKVKKTQVEKVKKVKQEVISTGNNTLTSGNNSVKKAKKNGEKVVKETKEQLKKKHNDKINVDKKGNGYGKDKKASAPGNKFEKQRATKARQKQVAKRKELSTTVISGNNKVSEANQKIKLAKEKLEKDKGTISEDEYNIQIGKINKATLYVKGLQSKLSTANKIKN